jgi:hypothetical protein
MRCVNCSTAGLSGRTHKDAAQRSGASEQPALQGSDVLPSTQLCSDANTIQLQEKERSRLLGTAPLSSAVLVSETQLYSVSSLEADA